MVKTVDVSLILYAEHDFNASTFAARVTCSTLSDFYSGICTGIGKRYVFDLKNLIKILILISINKNII